MRRFGLFVSALVTSLALLQSPATAGGWWSGIGLQGAHIGIDESMTIHVSDVLFRTMEEAREARQVDYYAYLLRGFDKRQLERAMGRPEPRRWWEPPTDILRVGTVELLKWDANLARAKVRLTIPEITTGGYHLMLCDDGCRRPLANIIPSAIRVAGDPLAAKAFRRAQETSERLDLEMARLRGELGAARRQLRAVDADAAGANEAIVRLVRRLAAQQETPERPWIPYGAWFLLGATMTLFTIRRRRRDVAAPSVPGIELIPDDPRELIERR